MKAQATKKRSTQSLRNRLIDKVVSVAVSAKAPTPAEQLINALETFLESDVHDSHKMVILTVVEEAINELEDRNA